VDGLWARQQVLERLRDAELPPDVTPSSAPTRRRSARLYRYTLTGAGGDPMKLRTLQDWVVRPMLLRVNGVADVVSYGGLLKEIHVQPEPGSSRSSACSSTDLESAIRKAAVNASGGVLERGSEHARHPQRGLFRSVDDHGERARRHARRTPILLKHVASVSEGWDLRRGRGGRRGHGDDDGRRRGHRPHAARREIRPSCSSASAQRSGRSTRGIAARPTVSEPVRVAPFYDRTERSGLTLTTVGRKPARGRLLVTCVLFVFLLDLRARDGRRRALPLSLLTSFIYLQSRGMSANLLSWAPSTSA
jgi:cobalt-zinc-cadmium resistance protein CzcA